MAIYGLQADIDSNPTQNVNLFTPGKTQLTAQDVFLGGEGTGVTDAMIGKATRVYGQDASKTQLALKNYHQDLSSQIKAAQATNDAPRVDADRGTATMARQAMEIGQAQNAVSNDLAQNTYDHGVAQDAFTNEYNVGNMMGKYKGNSTLSQRAQDIQDAQTKARLASEESQFARELASGNYNSAADRALSVQKSSMPTAAEIDDANRADAYGDVDRAIAVGTDWSTIRQEIMNNASKYPTGVSYTQVLAYAEAKYNTSVASSKAYPTSQQGLQQSADALTSSAFKRWYQ